jgi:phage terminase large subunit-like protein
LRRELYQKHQQFFRAGKYHRERLMIAANRTGKTEGTGGYEMALHLTGLYPRWWQGRIWDRPISAWAAGDTSQTVRDIIQQKLLGPVGDYGTGLIPGDLLLSVKNRAGSVPDTVEAILVQHVSGGASRLGLKSYDQKRKSFQGTEQDLIWLDEECPEDVYDECLMRTMTTGGAIMLTFTPLQGLTNVVLRFCPGGKFPENQVCV